MNIINNYLTKLSENNMNDFVVGDTIAVDLDGTLAYYDEFRGKDHIGKPIPKMMDRVMKWLDEGKKVVIFTARAHGGELWISPIKKWLKDNGLPDLEVTNVKTPMMTEFWDDRAIQVKPNTGEPVI